MLLAAYLISMQVAMAPALTLLVAYPIAMQVAAPTGDPGSIGSVRVFVWNVGYVEFLPQLGLVPTAFCNAKSVCDNFKNVTPQIMLAAYRITMQVIMLTARSGGSSGIQNNNAAIYRMNSLSESSEQRLRD